MWRRYCSDIEDTTEAFRLTGRSRVYALTLWSGRREALPRHRWGPLPSCLELTSWGRVRNGQYSQISGDVTDRAFADCIFTFERAKWAICTLAPFPSPKTEGIFTALLQRGPEEMLLVLLRIFRRLFTLGYIPGAWRKVVFIPKPGKADYPKPRWFRSISFSRFMLKTLARIVDRHIKEELLTLAPLHEKQYAYRAVRSTVAAFHHLARRLNKCL